MAGHQGSGTGGTGGQPPTDQESTQVGMPVPPQGPGYVAQPYGQPGQPPYGGPPAAPPGYGSAQPGYPPGGYAPPPGGYAPPPPGYTPPPAAGYGAPPAGYTPPPAGYGYSAPPPRRRGPSAILLGLLALLVVLALGVGGMYVAKLGPFAVAQVTAPPSGTPRVSATPRVTATPTASLAPTNSPSLPPTASPTPSPTPTVPPTATPTPTQPPTAPPPTVTPTSSGGDPAAVLLGHVPQAFASTCETSAGEAGGIASVACTAGTNDDVFVTYTLYADATSMQTAYDAEVSAWGAGAGSAACSKGANWPAEYEYTIDSLPAGRVLCVDIALPEMWWTDTRFNILSTAFTVTGTKVDLYTFWNQDSGPY